MTDPIQPPPPVVSTTQTNNSTAEGAVSAERRAKFSSAMIAASLRPPMISLAGANGDPDEPDPDPPQLPMRAPVIWRD